MDTNLLAAIGIAAAFFAAAIATGEILARRITSHRRTRQRLAEIARR